MKSCYNPIFKIAYSTPEYGLTGDTCKGVFFLFKNSLLVGYLLQKWQLQPLGINPMKTQLDSHYSINFMNN